MMGLSSNFDFLRQQFMTFRVLGISGVFKGAVRGCRRWWRAAFLGGMAAGAGVAAAVLPGMRQSLSSGWRLHLF